MNIKIYVLVDPRNGQIKYVGKTSGTLEKRLKHHFYNLHKGNNQHKRNWFNQLTKEGLKPIIEIIDEVPNEEWKFWEKYWISQIKTWGFNLVNHSEGGEGFSSEDVKKLWRKKEYREMQCARISPFKGRKHTEEAKEIMRQKCPKKGSEHGCFGKKLKKEDIESMRLNQPTLVTIIRMDMDENEIDTWVGLKKMCRELSLDEAAVLRVIKGKNKQHRKFKFKYKEE